MHSRNTSTDWEHFDAVQHGSNQRHLAKVVDLFRPMTASASTASDAGTRQMATSKRAA